VKYWSSAAGKSDATLKAAGQGPVRGSGTATSCLKTTATYRSATSSPFLGCCGLFLLAPPLFLLSPFLTVVLLLLPPVLLLLLGSLLPSPVPSGRQTFFLFLTHEESIAVSQRKTVLLESNNSEISLTLKL
jgi:hypothetical protein